MATSVSALSAEQDSRAAAREIGARVRAGLDGQDAHALIVFASPRHDFDVLLAGLAEATGTEVIAGASSAGEFLGEEQIEGGVSVLALRSERSQFSVALGRAISTDPVRAADELAAGFQLDDSPRFPYRSALIMTDALAGHADALVGRLTLRTGGNYRFFGGGAGDDARFTHTHVFAGRQAHDNAVVALEILSMEPVGIGVAHGWEPASERMRVTEVHGATLQGIDGLPAALAFEAHASATGQAFDREDPLPFFLHNVIGIETPTGYRLRVPLGVAEDGAISCAAEVPEGAVIRIMGTSPESAALAAEKAADAAVASLEGLTPGAAVVFDCVATRLRLGREFRGELSACSARLQPAAFIGCNTYGQIARAEGQFEGFHNCTAVVCVFPE